MNKKDNNTFFSSGAYGCVHYPRIKCDGKQKTLGKGKRKDGLISKLVLYDSKSKNEFSVGKKLKATSMLKNNPIVVVERLCEIKPKGVNKIIRGYKKCSDVLSRKKSKKYRKCKYVLFFSKYHKSITVKDYIYNHEGFSVSKVLKYFYFCVYVSNILKNFNVVHNDMHTNNIIYDENGHFHLIDFGLSLDIDKIYSGTIGKKTLNQRYLRSMMVKIDGGRITAPIEYHILIHFVFEQRALSDDDLRNMVNTYYESFKRKYWLSDTIDYDNFKLEVYNHYRTLFAEDVTMEKHILSIVIKAIYSWDLYRVALTCLDAIHRFGDETNSNIGEFKKTLYKCIHYDYAVRPSPEQLMKYISSSSLI